jgi:GNAT superfamily N-acetyltransferase
VPFGEAIDITRVRPLPDKPNTPEQVLLVPFDAQQAAEIVPAAPDDLALAHLSAPVRQTYTGSPQQLYEKAAGGYGSVTWGVRVPGEGLAGAATVRSAYDTQVNLFLTPQFRGRGVGELALAGVISAALAPGYLSARGDAPWQRTPSSLVAEVHNDNIAAEKLLRGFGFTYRSYRGAMGDSSFRVRVFGLNNFIQHSPRMEVDNQGVRLAHAVLRDDFAVKACGNIEIPYPPRRMLQPFG